jgi:hypothetical protein
MDTIPQEGIRVKGESVKDFFNNLTLAFAEIQRERDKETAKQLSK